jgi:hypothetical protein
MNLPSHPIAISLAEMLPAAAGIGTGSVAPASGLAFFLLGLITGVIAAVGAFFVYLHVTRTRRPLSRLDARGDLQEEIEEPPPPDPHSHQQPQRMPWERPDDWWRNES